MAHINEVPQPDGTVEYDVVWLDSDTGRRTRYKADGKGDALRAKWILERSGHSRAAAVRPAFEQIASFMRSATNPKRSKPLLNTGNGLWTASNEMTSKP